MDYLTLHDDHGNTVVVHAARRKSGKTWTASWSATTSDGHQIDHRTSDYYCSRCYVDVVVSDDCQDYRDLLWNMDGHGPYHPTQLGLLVQDALCLAWVRSRRDVSERKRIPAREVAA